MKTIYYKVKAREGSTYIIEYWTKIDKSNALKMAMVTLEESKVRNNIESRTGMKHFNLVFVKG